MNGPGPAALILLSVVLVGQACATEDDGLRSRANHLIRTIEDSWYSPESADDLTPEEGVLYRAALDSLPSVASSLDAHIAWHPRDSWAIILRGRALSMQYRSAFLRSNGVDPVPASADPRDSIAAVLRRAVRIDSTNAEAHFQIGWSYAHPILAVSDTGLVDLPARWDAALVPAITALRLKPGEERHQIMAELCLIAAGDFHGALSVRDPAGADSALAPIARRAAHIPPPPDGVDAPATRMLILRGFWNDDKLWSDSTIVRSAARVRAFDTNLAPEELISFYERNIPGIRFRAESFDVLETASATLQWTTAGSWRPVEPGTKSVSEDHLGFRIGFMGGKGFRNEETGRLVPAGCTVVLREFGREP